VLLGKFFARTLFSRRGSEVMRDGGKGEDAVESGEAHSSQATPFETLLFSWLVEKMSKIARKSRWVIQGKRAIFVFTELLKDSSITSSINADATGEIQTVGITPASLVPMMNLLVMIQGMQASKAQFQLWQETVASAHLLQECLLEVLGADGHATLMTQVSAQRSHRRIGKKSEHALLKVMAPREAALNKLAANAKRHEKKKEKKREPGASKFFGF
jgi:hypothetical protein